MLRMRTSYHAVDAADLLPSPIRAWSPGPQQGAAGPLCVGCGQLCLRRRVSPPQGGPGTIQAARRVSAEAGGCSAERSQGAPLRTLRLTNPPHQSAYATLSLVPTCERCHGCAGSVCSAWVWQGVVVHSPAAVSPPVLHTPLGQQDPLWPSRGTSVNPAATLCIAHF
jgi:hypothetical protein